MVSAVDSSTYAWPFPVHTPRGTLVHEMAGAPEQSELGSKPATENVPSAFAEVTATLPVEIAVQPPIAPTSALMSLCGP
jgi:hypothetical protein